MRSAAGKEAVGIDLGEAERCLGRRFGMPDNSDCTAPASTERPDLRKSEVASVEVAQRWGVQAYDRRQTGSSNGEVQVRMAPGLVEGEVGQNNAE